MIFGPWRLRALRALRAVALRGGVVDAARLPHLTTSAVSPQLAQLEGEIDQPVVDRSCWRAPLPRSKERGRCHGYRAPAARAVWTVTAVR
ncbi:LysR family transcriptional regulator [Kitasatospora sp. NPDC002965]|uniref:helix-turn-helix domain-containing protein n=1 Tax=Kitasatospora sp. NPDC002965 TaxID=3154775 RepID=UPI00339F88D6